MAEQIKKSDIINDDVLPSLKKGLQENLSVLEKMDLKLKSVAKSFTTLTNAEKKRLEGITKLNQQQLQAERLVKEKIKNDTERVKQQQQLVKLEALEQRQKVAIRKENERLLRLKEKLEKNLTDETNAYKRLVKQTRDYKNESKRLGAELLSLESAGKRNTKAYRDLSTAYKQVTASAKAGDKQLKKLDATVGDNFRNVGNYQKAIGGLRSALGSLGLAFGLREVVGNVAGTIVDFDQAVTDLSAISGKSREELSGLNNQAKELGATTQFTATEITGLQIELAKLGFTTKQIQDSTGGIADFASATGVEIPRASKLAGSALRAFNLEATEIDRVVSTLGVATTKTALDFSQLETGLSTVAPVASAFGFSIEDTTALLGQLANAGFDASSSATATRNILLNLADANGGLAKELGRPIKTADDLAKGLKELESRGIDLAGSLELTDKRSVSAFNTFLKGADTLPELRDSITDVNDELKAMAEKRLDSVSGQLALLNSAWEGFILQQSDASGVVDKLKSAIGFLAKNLGTILSVLGRLTRAFIVYKSVMLSLRLGRQIKNFAMLAVNIGKTAKASKDASGGIKNVGKSIKGINWASIIAVVVELAISFYDVASGARQARIDAENLENYQNTAGKQQSERSAKRQEDLRDEIELIDQRLRKEEITAEEALKLKEEATKRTKQAIQSDIDAVQNRIDKNKENLDVLDKIRRASVNFQIDDFKLRQIFGVPESEAVERFGEALASIGISLEDVTNVWGNFNTDNFSDGMGTLSARIGAGETKLEGYNDELKETTKGVNELETQTVELGKTQEDNTSKVDAQVKSYEDVTEKIDKTNKALKENLSIQQLIQEIEDLEINRAISSQENDLDKIIEDEQRRLENVGGDVNFSQIDEVLKSINDLRVQRANDELERKKEEAKETIENQQQLNLELEKLELEHKAKIEQINEQDAENRIEISDNLNSIKTSETETTNTNTVNSEKELYTQLNQIQQQITDGLKENIDKRIELKKREADEAQNLQNFYQELANSGNINAQQSITKQIELQREALKEQERLERQKAKLELISSGLNTFATELEKGKKPQEAFATTVLTSQALVQFLGNLSAFEKGTDNAPKGLAWTQEKGAEIITDKKGNIKSLGSNKGPSLTMLDAGDKVYNAQKSKSIIENLRSSKDGDLIRRAKESSGNSYDLMRLESLMKEQTQTLKNKKEIEIHWDSVQRGLVERVKRGKDVGITIYRTK